MLYGSVKQSSRIILLIGILASSGLTLWLSWNRDRRPADDSEAGATNQPIRLARATNEPIQAPQTGTNILVAAARGFQKGRSPETARATLEQLRRHISSLPADVALKEIREALDSGVDAPTGMQFKLAKNGTLAQAPTLRLFLLDQLAQIDATTAAAYAEKILSSCDSPDEWAVSMRSYALVRTNTESRTFLQQKFREMIAQNSWRSAPSVGFLEAFDVAVHLGGTALLPDLTALVRDKDNKAVTHAAYLALDRLTINEPAVVLADLQRQPDVMAGREATRANLFARADVGDPQQKKIVEHYLLNPRLDGAELQTFAGLFPNANYMISQNLLTRTITPDRNTLVARDRQALETVTQWLVDVRFLKLRPQLEQFK